MLKICVTFLSFSLSFVQVISTHFLHGFTRLSDPDEVGIVDKVRGEDSEPKKVNPKVVFTWRENLQMKSASDDNKPFLVELIHAVISTVETRHRRPMPLFTVTQPAIYILFFVFLVVVFFFIIQD